MAFSPAGYIPQGKVSSVSSSGTLFHCMCARGVSKGVAGGAIAPPLFGRIEGTTPHYYLHYYLPPTSMKPLMPLFWIGLNSKEEGATKVSFCSFWTVNSIVINPVKKLITSARLLLLPARGGRPLRALWGWCSQLSRSGLKAAVSSRMQRPRPLPPEV